MSGQSKKGNTMDEREQANDKELGDLIRKEAIRHAAPAHLRAQIVDALRHQEAPRHHRQSPRNGLRAWWMTGFSFACGALLTWLALPLLPGAGSPDRIDSDIVNAHVRAVMMARAVDVESSDQHTVKPWLSSRLDFSPPVQDLAAEGFPLAGGRLDYVNGRTVAVLVYKRNKHWIDVFVAPAAGKPAGRSASKAVNGFNVIGWTRAGLDFEAISDVGAGELATFADSLQAHIAAGS